MSFAESSTKMVTIDGITYQMNDLGSQATIATVRHTNLCFYLSATADIRYVPCIANFTSSVYMSVFLVCSEEAPHTATRNNAEAVALKHRLAALANAQPQLGTKKHQFGAASQLAEWPVFYSYAEQVGPIIVASQEAGVSTMYVATTASKDPVYLYHNKNHFQRLIPCSPHV